MQETQSYKGLYALYFVKKRGHKKVLKFLYIFVFLCIIKLSLAVTSDIHVIKNFPHYNSSYLHFESFFTNYLNLLGNFLTQVQ